MRWDHWPLGAPPGREHPVPPGSPPALGGVSLSASLSMKGTRNRLTSESRKSAGSPGKMSHCSMDRVPARASISHCSTPSTSPSWVMGRTGVLTLVAQVRVGHELVDHEVHLPQLAGTEVLSARLVLQEDWARRGAKIQLVLATWEALTPSPSSQHLGTLRTMDLH